VSAERVTLTDEERAELWRRVYANWAYEDDGDTKQEVSDVADGVAVWVEDILADRLAAREQALREEVAQQKAALARVEALLDDAIYADFGDWETGEERVVPGVTEDSLRAALRGETR